MRRCPACGKELTRRTNEKRAEFITRKYCNFACSVVGRSTAAQEKRAEIDLRDALPSDAFNGLTFARSEVLRRAHMAAPQIPVALLADVVDAVEPLIASNTRRKILAHVGAEVRSRR